MLHSACSIVLWLRHCTFCIFLLASAAAAVPLSNAWSEEREILASVNGEPVTRSELVRMMVDREWKDADNDEWRRAAMRSLIQRRLFLQEAARRNLTVTEEDLDEALMQLRRRFDDLKSFGAWMKERDLDDRSLFQTLRETLLARRVTAALLADVRVTEDEIGQYYEIHKPDLRTEEVWIQIIVVKERVAAEEIQAALRRGEDFGRLAQRRSVGIRASRGGDVGWVDSETLWPPMQRAVSTLKPGEAIGPLPRGDEFLIVRLHERRPGRTKSFQAARATIEERLLTQKRQEAIEAWLTAKEREAKIELFSEKK
jgi:parvulin-like peptidyl-prolyl isomerase